MALLRIITPIKLALLAYLWWKGVPTWLVMAYATGCGLLLGGAVIPLAWWLRRRFPHDMRAWMVTMKAFAVIFLLLAVAAVMAWDPWAGAVAVGWATHQFGPPLWASVRSGAIRFRRWCGSRSLAVSPAEVERLRAELAQLRATAPTGALSAE